MGEPMATRVQDVEPFAGHSPGQERPLGGYATLMGAFLASSGGFAGWMRATGRELPERVDGRDLALMTVATHKAARLLAKDRVTSAVRAPRRCSPRTSDRTSSISPTRRPRTLGSAERSGAYRRHIKNHMRVGNTTLT